MKQKQILFYIITIFFAIIFQAKLHAQVTPKVEAKESPYYFLFEIPMNVGVGSVTVAGNDLQNQDFGYGFRMIAGIHDRKTVLFGVGVGIDKYREVTLLPISLDLRIPFSKSAIAPMIILNGGYSIGLGDAVGGLVIDPSLALKIDLPKTKTTCFIAMGYKWQGADVQYTYVNYYSGKIYPTYTSSVFLQFFTMNFGMYF